MKIPLLEFVQATADANGRAVAVTGPERFGETWDVSLISTNTTSNSESQLKVYRGIESESARLLSTYSGNSDNASGGKGISVSSGDKLVFVWSGADSGAICTARLEGDFLSGRR